MPSWLTWLLMAYLQISHWRGQQQQQRQWGVQYLTVLLRNQLLRHSKCTYLTEPWHRHTLKRGLSLLWQPSKQILQLLSFTEMPLIPLCPIDFLRLPNSLSLTLEKWCFLKIPLFLPKFPLFLSGESLMLRLLHSLGREGRMERSCYGYFLSLLRLGLFWMNLSSLRQSQTLPSLMLSPSCSSTTSFSERYFQMGGRSWRVDSCRRTSWGPCRLRVKSSLEGSCRTEYCRRLLVGCRLREEGKDARLEDCTSLSFTKSNTSFSMCWGFFSIVIQISHGCY